MVLENFERGNCIKTDVEFRMDDVPTDPSGSKAFIDVIRPDGTYLVEHGSGTRSDVGKYHFYFQTRNTDPLGLYMTVWKAQHNLGGEFGYKDIVQRRAINIIYEED